MGWGFVDDAFDWVEEQVPVVGDVLKLQQKAEDKVAQAFEGTLVAVGMDPASAAGVGKFLGATLTGNPTGAVTGLNRSNEVKDEIKKQRELAASNEQARLNFNNDIFSLANSLTGSSANSPYFDLSSLAFQGDDPRQEQLDTLNINLKTRQSSIIEGISRPGENQTRLSLV